jgi:MFS family permease
MNIPVVAVQKNWTALRSPNSKFETKSGIEKRRRRSLIPVFLTFFLDNFGLAVIYPIFTPLVMNPNEGFFASSPTFFTRTLTLGLLIGAFPLAQFFASPLIGQYSDRYGRKRAFYFTILGTTLGYALTACAIAFHSLHLLFASRWITGLCAGNLTICLAALADLCPDEHIRAKNFGHISAIGGLSFILAILVGGVLSDPVFYRYFSPSIPFWITAFLSLLNFILMVILFHETHPTHVKKSLNPFQGIQNLKMAVADGDLRVLYGTNFFFKIAWVASMQFLPAFLIKIYAYPSHQITYVLLGVGAAWTLANWVINRLLAKWVYPGISLLYSLGLLALFTFLLAFDWPAALFLTFFFLSAAGASLSWTTGMATLSIKAPAQIQGSILGVNQSVTALASVCAPALGGLLIGIEPGLLYLFCGGCCLVAFILLRLSHAYRPKIHV